MTEPVPVVAVAGASGFIGRHLVDRLARQAGERPGAVIAMSRSAHEDPRPQVCWRQCDLFNLLQTERALQGAEVGVYLTHSMLPTARLTQGRFQDMDIILADNFARAARTAGVKRILYLGGILPQDNRELSDHLRSRREVERALAGHGTPVTTLRAGLIIGAEGSSFGLLRRLLERSPFLPAPPWTRSRVQPIAIDDVLDLLLACLSDDRTAGQTYDIAGPEVVTYRQLLAATAAALGRRRARILPLPLPLPIPDRWLVRLVAWRSRTPPELVGPLLESLHHSMLPGELALQERLGMPGMTLSQMLARALAPDAAPTAIPEAPAGPTEVAPRHMRNTVRSVQRLPLPEGRDATWVGEEFMRWLPRGPFWPLPLLRVTVEGNLCQFFFRPIPRPLLVLTYAPERSTPERGLFYVTGGILAHPANRKGRLEFRCILGGEAIIAAIHDFVPRLPWFIYTSSQALAHVYAMWRFGRHLRRQVRTRRRARIADRRLPREA